MTTLGMPYYLAPVTAPHMFRNVLFSLSSLKTSSFSPTTSFQNFKEKIPNNNRYQSGINNFSLETPETNAHFQAFTQATNELKALKHRDLLKNPNIANTYLAKVEKAFHLYREQQKLIFDQSFNTIPEVEKEKLWTVYEKELSQLYQPITRFSQQIESDGLLTQAMRHYVLKIMGKKNQSHTTLQTGIDNVSFTPRPQFEDSQGKPITVSYDKEGKATEIRVNPFLGNVGDALAIAIASHGKMLPMKITVPLSNADILKSEMEVGPSLFIILLAHTLVRKLQTHLQKNQVLKAAFEKGIPLKHISLLDNRGRPIPISHSEQEKLNETHQQWAKRYNTAELTDQASPDNQQALPGLNLRPSGV